MKKIVVGIDFSECSINALDHALTLAAKFESDLTMVWVNPDDTKALLSNPKKADFSHLAKAEFERIVEQNQSKLPFSTLDYKILDGRIYNKIIEYSEEQEAGLIVLGTHGTTGFEEFWIGSNASRIVMASNSPVLTIREGCSFNNGPMKIVMPIDSTMETRQKATFTAVLSEIFDAEIHVLAIHTSSVYNMRRIVDDYVKQVVKYFEEENVKYIIENIDASNIATATIEYSERVGASLISIMTEQETTTMNLFLGPYAQQIINHSPIPVLSQPPKEFIRTLSR
ncbi:MAG: universal stress protein [Bacteroidales bacterium]|nr:universal stress protein [Bacteroidales bacterium]